MADAASVLNADQGERLDVVGDRVRVLHAEPGCEAGVEVFEVSGERDNGPPQHRHDWQEWYFCLAGRIEFNIDGRIVHGTPGTFLTIPAGAAHSYRMLGDDARFLTVTDGAGRTLAFFRDMHVSLHGAPRGPAAAIASTARVCGNHGVEVIAPTQ